MPYLERRAATQPKDFFHISSSRTVAALFGHGLGMRGVLPANKRRGLHDTGVRQQAGATYLTDAGAARI